MFESWSPSILLEIYMQLLKLALIRGVVRKISNMSIIVCLDHLHILPYKTFICNKLLTLKFAHESETFNIESDIHKITVRFKLYNAHTRMFHLNNKKGGWFIIWLNVFHLFFFQSRQLITQRVKQIRKKGERGITTCKHHQLIIAWLMKWTWNGRKDISFR